MKDLDSLIIGCVIETAKDGYSTCKKGRKKWKKKDTYRIMTKVIVTGGLIGIAFLLPKLDSNKNKLNTEEPTPTPTPSSTIS